MKNNISGRTTSKHPSVYKRLNNWLHLWLGLVSGLVVLIVCITGCIWAFNEEITNIIEPENLISNQQKPVLKPSTIATIAKSAFPKLEPAYAQYKQGKVIYLYLNHKGKIAQKGQGDVLLKIHPYTGAIIAKIQGNTATTSFFRWILEGHRTLWLKHTGSLIINYATLIFLVIIITGLVWWYPKKWTKTNCKKSFTIKWTASFKRLNLDLHNVLGFYASWFLLCVALTGLVFGLRWFASGVYWVSSGGTQIDQSFRTLKSDSTQTNMAINSAQAMDLIWEKVQSENPKSEGFYYSYPNRDKVNSTIHVTIFPNAQQFYSSRGYTFDQYTLKALERKDPYAIPLSEANFAQKLRKMNYEIHVGTILGFTGKVLVFLAGLIGASLPITGFLVWYGRKFKKRKQ